jgi:transcriptional regulator with XRE-family HTH domain
MAIGDRIRSLRKEHDWTQKDLAQKLGIADSTVSLYESNTNKPDGDMIKKLSQVFDVSADYLLADGEDESRNIRSTLEVRFVNAGLEEFALVKKYSMLSEDNRKIIHNLIDSMLEINKK